MRTKIVRWGNSLGLRIPKSFAEEVKVREGSTVDLGLERGRLVVRGIEGEQPTLDELLAEVTEDNLHGEIES